MELGPGHPGIVLSPAGEVAVLAGASLASLQQGWLDHPDYGPFVHLRAS